MKNIIIIVAIFSIFSGIGCLNDSNTKIQRAEPSSATVAPLINDTNANKIQTTTIPPFPAAIRLKPVSTAALNPEHVQPGQRGDIAEGAP
jgi:hypothetical protein